VLSGCLRQTHAPEGRGVGQNAHVGEALVPYDGGVRVVLHEDRQTLGDDRLSRLVPVIGMGVGDDHGVDRQKLWQGRGQRDQRIAKMAHRRSGEAREGALVGQHGVHQKTNPGIVDPQCGVADLGHCGAARAGDGRLEGRGRSRSDDGGADQHLATRWCEGIHGIHS
jgi:hypothetical protein